MSAVLPPPSFVFFGEAVCKRRARMQLLGAVVALVLAIALFLASVLVDRAGKDVHIETEQACVARERTRVASPFDFNTNPCFQWDGGGCRHGSITAQGCDVGSQLPQKVLSYLSMASLTVGVVLFFVPTRAELERPRRHHHRPHHHGDD